MTKDEEIFALRAQMELQETIIKRLESICEIQDMRIKNFLEYRDGINAIMNDLYKSGDLNGNDTAANS